MKAIITILLSLFILFSCKKEKTDAVQNKVVSHKETNKKITDSLRNHSIFVKENEKGLTRIWVRGKEKQGNYFYSDTLNVIMVSQYRFADEKLNLVKEVDIEETVWSYLTIDSTNVKIQKIGKNDYVFLSSRVAFMGNAITEQTVSFWMLNLKDIRDCYSLQYVGKLGNQCDKCLRGSFEENSTLKSSKMAKTALYQYAQTSKLIDHPSDQEKEISHYKNYEEKWKLDNAADNEFGAGHAVIPDVIYSTYYDENLFKLTSASEEFIENKYYKIQSIFRGNLIGFDKKRRRYFPVIVESCSHFCNKDVEFIGGQKLKITYEDNESSEINLSKIVFK